MQTNIAKLNTDRAKVQEVYATSDGQLLVKASGSGTSSDQVQGTAAGNAAAVGNPVQTGGIYEATPSTYDNGDAVPLHTDTRGGMYVVLKSPDGALRAEVTAASSEGSANSAGLVSIGQQRVWNGTGWDRLRGDTSGAYAQGNVAAAATDAGNPVKVGGKYNSTLPTYTDGQRGDLQIGTRGSLNIQLREDGGNNTATIVALSVDAGSALTGLNVNTSQKAFNGTTWDRVRSNIDTAALITAAGATTTQNSADQTNYNGRGVKVVLDMTDVGTGSVTITLQGKDAASGKYYTLLTGAAVVTNSTNAYEVYPGVTATANVSASSVLPRVWRVLVTANNANATTYTVGASVIL